jgi:hypothetical protein
LPSVNRGDDVELRVEFVEEPAEGGGFVAVPVDRDLPCRNEFGECAGLEDDPDQGDVEQGDGRVGVG